MITHIHEAEAGASRLMLVAMYAPHLLATATIANSRVQPLGHRRASTVARPANPGGLQRRRRARCSASPARASLEGRPVRLTYVGRLSPRKGTDLVITAAAELVDDGVDVEVDILGEAFDGLRVVRR